MKIGSPEELSFLGPADEDTEGRICVEAVAPDSGCRSLSCCHLSVPAVYSPPVAGGADAVI